MAAALPRLFYLDVDDGGEPRVYAVDVPYWHRILTSDGNGRAYLYLDGRHLAQSSLPAASRVHGGTIEVAPTSYGLRRCHFVPDSGTEHALGPDLRSAEGQRKRLAQTHPALDRLLKIASLIFVVVVLLLIVPQVADAVSHVPPIAERFGTFTSPVDLPSWFNAVLTLCASIASVERATRLQWNRLLDS